MPNLRFIGFAVCSLFLLSHTTQGATVERILRSDLKPLKDGMPGELGLRKEVNLASNLTMTAVIEVTAKGNGTLHLGNLNLRVYDSHDDGNYYENGLLNIDLCDIDGDGRREVVISGVNCVTDEKATRIVRREAVVFIYALQPDQRFKQVYTNTNMRLE